jgi:hypothetical protein
MKTDRIPDLHYIVIKSRGAFVRAAHVVVFYRHDRDGKPFIYHMEPFYGSDGRKTLADARCYGRDLVERRVRFACYRQNYVRVYDEPAVRKAGLDPNYRG